MSGIVQIGGAGLRATLSALLACTLAGSGLTAHAAPDLTKRVSFESLEGTLEQTLLIVAEAMDEKIVCALPMDGAKASLAVKDAPGWRALEGIADRYRLNWWLQGDVIVMRPVPLPPQDGDPKKRWRRTWGNDPAQGMIAFLASLSPEQLALLHRGMMLRVPDLSPPQRDVLFRAGSNRERSRAAWDRAYAAEDALSGVTVMFDPYFDPGDGGA